MTSTTNIFPQEYHLSKPDRQRMKGHGSCIVWFTGLSGSGKSTIANAVEQRLYEKGIHTYVLDGDNIRHGLNSNIGFTAEDRKENIRRIGEVAKLFVDAGIVVLTAFISPYRDDRSRVRSLVQQREFLEIFVNCSLETCEKRDVKGLYKKAREGMIPDFTGINAPFEEPLQPELTVNTENISIDAAVEKVMNCIMKTIEIK
jgi:adenylylsulfate kinase